LKERVDSQNKLLDIQTARISDLTTYLGAFGIILTILTFFASFVVFLSVKARAIKEARDTATEWFNKNGKQDMDRLLGDTRADLDDFRAYTASQRQRVEKAAQAEIEALQIAMQRPQNPVTGTAVSASAEIDPLQQLVDQLKQKPESDYAFSDWNTRAFNAYREQNFALAGEYWLKAANARNTTHSDLATSMLNAAVALHFDGKDERSLDLYDGLVGRFGTASEAVLREQAAKALSNKSVMLIKQERYEDAITASNDLLALYGKAPETALQEQVGRALANKGEASIKLGRCDEAIESANEILAHFGLSMEIALREQVGRALFLKSAALTELQRFAEAIEAANEVETRFGAAPEAVFRDIVAASENVKGFATLMISKQHWTDIEKRALDLQAALACFERAKFDNGSPHQPFVFGNMAYALFLLSRMDEARRALTEALRKGGKKLRDAEVKDTERFPLQEDAEFRALIDDVWKELHPEDDTKRI
jgi:hypothetical protein